MIKLKQSKNSGVGEAYNFLKWLWYFMHLLCLVLMFYFGHISVIFSSIFLFLAVGFMILHYQMVILIKLEGL